MSQGGQTSRRTPQYNDPYQAINAVGVMNTTSPGKPFGAGNSMSDPFANQPKPNQSPTVYTTQDNNYQNPVLGGVSQTIPANNVYAGTTSLGTMSSQANPYAVTQANAMQYTNTTNSLFPLNQVDGEKNGLRLNPDLNSFDTPSQPVDQNYVGGNLGQQPVAQQSQPNTYGNTIQPYGNNNGANYNQAPINSTSNYNIARDYDQMYMSAPLLPQVGDARPSGNTSPYQNNNPYFDTSTAEGSMDYLNSIAPSEQPKTGLVALKPSKLFPIIGGAMLILVILVAVVAALGGSQKNGPAEKAVALNSSISNLQTVVDYGRNNDQFSSSVVDTLAETNLILASNKNAFNNAGLGTDTSSGDSSNSADSSSSNSDNSEQTTTESFSDQMTKAKNNGTLEKSYETSLQNSVKDVIAKTEDAYNSIDDDNAKQVLSNFYKNITELSKHIDNAVNSDSPTSGLIKYYTYVQK